MAENPIPVVTYAMARPFAKALEVENIPVEPVLASVGLEPGLSMDDHLLIAAQNWYDFAEEAARILDRPDLGYSIGADTAMESLPNLRVLELPLATLGELLTALVVDVQRFSTIARYSLWTDGTHATLSTQRTFSPNTPPAQIDGFFAGFMVRILASCSGERWTPSELEIGVCEPSALPPTIRNSISVRQVGLEGAAFRFPALWLLQRTDGALRQVSLTDARTNREFLDTLRAMLDLHLDRQGLTLSKFAALTGQSSSSLKRQLNSHGTSYQSELDRRRAFQATFLLRTTDMSLGEIGAKVGYPDPPSFSRAFKRWMSVTPGRYRKGNELTESVGRS